MDLKIKELREKQFVPLADRGKRIGKGRAKFGLPQRHRDIEAETEATVTPPSRVFV